MKGIIDFGNVIGFNWDAGNARKNDQHTVLAAQAEQIFVNTPLLLLEDVGHSQRELRFHAPGKADTARGLHITLTLRQAETLIRVISARD